MSEDGSANILRWLICGATAGLAVDIGLYPLDTIKSRLQSKEGFISAGGFRNIYSGMSSVMVGSAPGAAIFFLTYRSINHYVANEGVMTNAFSASLAEIAACAVRVPTELCKQRSQVKAGQKLLDICRFIYHQKGLRGFYQGYSSTVTREIPFSVIQFPIYEQLKRLTAAKKESECTAFEGAVCGSIAGSIAAALTTPLDVAKTRIMLCKLQTPPTVLEALKEVVTTGGFGALYSGIVPRVLWISSGGFVFFGAYETAMSLTTFLA